MSMWRSKLGTQYSRDLIDKLDAEHHKVLKKLRAEPSNAHCAECGDLDTTWASVSLGVFLCVRCADVHRALGTHISKVKGCSGTYLWGPDEIERMQSIGNAKAEKLYGGAGGAPRPSKEATKEERIALCTKKYVTQACAQMEMPAVTKPAREDLAHEPTNQRSLKFEKKEQKPFAQSHVRRSPTNQPFSSLCRPAAHEAPRKIAAANMLDIDSFFDDILAVDSKPALPVAEKVGPEVTRKDSKPCMEQASTAADNNQQHLTRKESDIHTPEAPRKIPASANVLDTDSFFDDILAADSKPAVPEAEDVGPEVTKKSLFRPSTHLMPTTTAASGNTLDADSFFDSIAAVNSKPFMQQDLAAADNAQQDLTRKESDIHAHEAPKNIAVSANVLDTDSFFDDILAADSKLPFQVAEDVEPEVPRKSLFRSSVHQAPTTIAASGNTVDVDSFFDGIAAVDSKPVMEQDLAAANNTQQHLTRKESDVHAFLEECLSIEGGIGALKQTQKNSLPCETPALKKTEKLVLGSSESFWAEFGL